MRWKKEKPQWKIWYAWRPVKTGNGEWAWLERVWSRRYMDRDGYTKPWWGYRPYQLGELRPSQSDSGQW